MSLVRRIIWTCLMIVFVILIYVHIIWYVIPWQHHVTTCDDVITQQSNTYIYPSLETIRWIVCYATMATIKCHDMESFLLFAQKSDHHIGISWNTIYTGPHQLRILPQIVFVNHTFSHPLHIFQSYHQLHQLHRIVGHGRQCRLVTSLNSQHYILLHGPVGIVINRIIKDQICVPEIVDKTEKCSYIVDRMKTALSEGAYIIIFGDNRGKRKRPIPLRKLYQTIIDEHLPDVPKQVVHFTTFNGKHFNAIVSPIMYSSTNIISFRNSHHTWYPE